MNSINKKALYESIMSNISKIVKKLLNEGAGAGYDIEIKDIKLGNFQLAGNVTGNTVNNDHTNIQFTADILTSVVEWKAEGYYEGLNSEGIYYDGEMMREFSDEENTIYSGKVIGYVELDDINDDDVVSKFEIIDFLEDYASTISISLMYGGGWSHVDLKSPVFEFEDVEAEGNGNYTTFQLSKISINAPQIADNINWYFAHAYEFDEIFGNNEEDYDE